VKNLWFRKAAMTQVDKALTVPSTLALPFSRCTHDGITIVP
jgi:hypothetical protein